MKIALLHPGAMGVTVAQSLIQSGHQVSWLPVGRSAATRERAQQAQLTEAGSVSQLCENAQAVISVCPPEQALAVAEVISGNGFDGLYLDANAIAPMTARRIAALFPQRYVDGGIIGPPAHTAGTTRLYLSGEQAPAAVQWFAQGPLTAIDMATVQPQADLVSASTLKMAYAAYTKGVSALLLNVCALAEAGAVTEALQYEWSLSQPQLLERVHAAARGGAPKAWRFAGEMQQIADTFSASGLPDQFHRGAADVYQRMAPLKSAMSPDLAAVLAVLAAHDTEVD